MLDRILQWGPHEAQMALTVTLLAATAILALLCDVLRFRAWSGRVAEAAIGKVGPNSEAAATLRIAIAPTLVPEGIRVHGSVSKGSPSQASPKPQVSTRASRLAAALKQPRRVLSPAAKAAIERGAHAAHVTPAPAELPTGFQDSNALARLTAAHRRVTGLVVAIALSGAEESDHVATFQDMFGSLLEVSDFAAPLAAGDFVLILPSQGDAARRRMRELSQRLWDLQMHSLAERGVSFQWGGLEVEDQLIQDAVRMALEHRESRGDRKLPASQQTKSMSRAV